MFISILSWDLFIEKRNANETDLFQVYKLGTVGYEVHLLAGVVITLGRKHEH